LKATVFSHLFLLTSLYCLLVHSAIFFPIILLFLTLFKNQVFFTLFPLLLFVHLGPRPQFSLPPYLYHIFLCFAYSSTLKMEAEDSSKTFVTIYQTTLIMEYTNIQQRTCL
jgi:hypothetical protein